MNAQELKSNTWEEAAALLGVSTDADEQALCAAYLAKIRTHPPDREPEAFERIRDAYDQLRNPMSRAKKILEGPSPGQPLVNLIAGRKPRRKFVGPKLWVDLLKEGRS